MKALFLTLCFLGLTTSASAENGCLKNALTLSTAILRIEFPNTGKSARTVSETTCLDQPSTFVVEVQTPVESRYLKFEFAPNMKTCKLLAFKSLVPQSGDGYLLGMGDCRSFH
ncbi:MAG: hypothetical protein H7301_14565 [Cryobacterium sp.]|nr:hypothetical protein [Oligoflexia bacterium]